MRQKQDLYLDLEATTAAKDIVQTYEEIAASRLMSVRGSVSQTRAFLDEVAIINQHVRQAYELWQLKLKKSARKKTKSKSTSAIQKNGKVIRILLSANKGLYGDLPIRIVREFIAQCLEDNYREKPVQVDIAAVGRVGQYLLDNPPAGAKKLQYKGFIIDDDKPTEEQINELFTYILPYERVIITYGKFQSLLSLKAETVDLTGGELPTPGSKVTKEMTDEAKKLAKRILFEPTIATVTAFFETEILKALLRQKIYEMQLARYASRMIAMDQAEDKAKQRLALLRMEDKKIKRKISNKKLRQISATSIMWLDANLAEERSF